MELNEYQSKAMSTCMPTSRNFSYMMLNLMGEVGEFSSKVAKLVRREVATIGAYVILHPKGTTDSDGYMERIFTISEDLKKEAGDILWQLSGLCNIMGWTLEEVAEANLAKLASRQQRGVIDGNGDNR